MTAPACVVTGAEKKGGSEKKKKIKKRGEAVPWMTVREKRRQANLNKKKEQKKGPKPRPGRSSSISKDWAE